MQIMVEGVALLEKRGIGTKESRKTIRNLAYVAYYKDTGLDLDTKKPPNAQTLAWLKSEVSKQDKLKSGN